MTVNRTEIQSGPAVMTVHFTSPSSASSSQPPINSTTTPQTSTAPVATSSPGPTTERTEVINMKHRDESEILSQLMALTKAKPVKATAEETRQLQELQEHEVKSSKDRERMAAVTAERKKEEAILIQARGEVEAMKES
jgi:large subunit ribosomal protein MRP49